MLNGTECELWCAQVGLTAEAVAVVNQIRTSEPVRSVGANGGNVTGRYPSQKMGRTIQFESHTCELSFILLCEFPEMDDVIEYWDQPYKLPVTYKNKKGRTVRTHLVPDFFLLRKEAAEFVECKTEEQLVRLAKEQPNKYRLDADGNWRCPPGEAAAAMFGIKFRVVSTRDINPTLIRNTVFLEDYLRGDVPVLSSKVTSPIIESVLGNEGISLFTLLAVAEGAEVAVDTVYQLIANGTLYVDLRREALINYTRVHVYSSKPAAIVKSDCISFPKGKFVELTAGALIQWGEKIFEIANLDQNSVWLVGEANHHPTVPREHFEDLILRGEIGCASMGEAPSSDPQWMKLWNAAKLNAQEEAQRRYDLIMRYRRKEPLSKDTTPLRTLRLWTANYRRAETFYGNGLVGLLPDWALRGDRTTQRIKPHVLDLMTDFIENDYERNIQSSMFSVYGKLRLACKAIAEKPPAYTTFVRYIGKRPIHDQELKRMGSRAAYDSEPFYYYLKKDTPRHGDRPFEICHIDHTLLGIELIDPITGQNFGRPWASFLVDAFTRRILVAYLAFEPPSYRTSMMVLRDCVRRFGRLPQILVVDRGPDFTSTYFQCLAAAFEITLKWRPKAKPRFGSVIENLFDVAQEQFIYNLTGNTQLTRKNARLTTPSHNPRNLAKWSLGPLYERLCDWAYNRYDVMEHSTLKQSPRSLYVVTIRLTGERRHRMLAYSEDFKLLTQPTTKKGTAKNIKNKGVKINNDYYWSAALDTPELLEKQLHIRYDPYDHTVAWVYARDRWVKCYSQDHYQVVTLTESEMRIRSAEKARRNLMFTRRAGERAEKLAQGIIQDQEYETELSDNFAILQGREEEDAKIRNIINQTPTKQQGKEQSALASEASQQQNCPPNRPTAFSSVAEDNVQILEEYV
jgi:transposase InsO family protein